MSIYFTKLFASITESTIWVEPDPIRLMWITMLAMADRKGRVWGSIPGLANRARVTVDQAEEAINRFLSPDKYSRTEENEGRRIAPIDGGWLLLNHAKYRAIQDDETVRETKRVWAKKNRASKKVEKVDIGRHPKIQAEADLEAEALKTKTAARKRAVCLPEDFKPSEAVLNWARFQNLDDRVEKTFEYFIGYVKANGKKYVDWDQALMNAIRDDWAGLKKQNGSTGDWWRSQAGIDAKSKEKNCYARPGESQNDFIGRLKNA